MFKDITHSQLEAQILRFFEGGLDCVQQGRLEHHLEICKKCKRKVDKLFLQRLRAKGLEESLKYPEKPCANCLSDETIEEYVLNKLTTEEKRLVDKHLYIDECTECNLRVEAYEKYQSWLERKRKEITTYIIAYVAISAIKRKIRAYGEEKPKFELELQKPRVSGKIKGLKVQSKIIDGELIVYLSSERYKTARIKITLYRKKKTGQPEKLATKITDRSGRINFGEIGAGKYIIGFRKPQEK